tara:strand:+ start:10259 stop:13153 length:2895 start_codon:yes stop_codon:yes gene_type:complete
MERWRIHFLGVRNLPADLSDFEQAHFFSFDSETRQAIRGRRNDCHRLGFAIHLGFLRMTGRPLDAFEHIPPSLLRHIRNDLAISTPELASLRALYGRRKTLYDHQSWAIRHLGLKNFTRQRAGALLRRVREEAARTLDVNALVQFSRVWLYENQILIPAERRLQDLCRRAQGESEQELRSRINALVPEIARNRLLSELSRTREGEGISFLEWLQQPPKRRSPNGLKEVSQKITYLQSLGIADFRLPDIRLELQQAYASRMRKRRPARFKKLREPRKTIELVFWARVTLMQLMDVALEMSSMQISKLERVAKEEVREDEAALAGVLRSYIAEAASIGLDDEIPDREARQRMLEALAPVRVAQTTQAARVRREMASNARRTRPLLRTILNFPLQFDATEPVAQAVNLMRDLYERKARALPKEANIDFAPSWSDVLGSEDRREALRGFEAALLQTLKVDIRRGAIWVDDSLNHRCRNETLMPETFWSKNNGRLRKELRISKSSEKHLKPLLANLKVGLAGLERAVETGEVVIADGQLHLPAMEAEETSSEVEHERRQIFSEIGTIDWPVLITQMDSMVRFSWTLLGRAPCSEKELLSVYGALLAHGTEMSAAAVAMTIPGVSAGGVGQAMGLLEDSKKLQDANQLVVSFLRSHTVAKAWGQGTIASSDAMSLEASRHLWNARVDPRHRRHAVGMYTHVLDQWGIIYDHPIVLNQRQAGVAIEGVVRQRASTELSRLAVDTHGYTDFAMATSKLLGFDLCPRLKNLSHRNLHIPPSFEAPGTLREVITRDVRTMDIEKGWDDLIRVVASIDGGWTSGMLALERFGSASRKDPIFKAGSSLGKLYRSLFLCDYFTNPSFRRELLRILNHGESVHVLQRAIYFGSIGVSRGRRREELVAISGSLTLLSNLVMAWTTHAIQCVLDRRARKGRSLPDSEILRHIAPVHTKGINFRGRFHFPIKTHAQRILAA